MNPGVTDEESHWKALKSQGGAQESHGKTVRFAFGLVMVSILLWLEGLGEPVGCCTPA